MNDSFLFYKSYYDALKELPDDVRLAAYDAIASYALYGHSPSLEGTAKAVFLLMLPNIDAAIKRHSANKANGSKGGRRPSQTDCKADRNQDKTQTKPNSNPTYNLERERDRELERDWDIPPYSPPTGGMQGESLTVEMAGGTGNEKPANHSTTLAKQFSAFWEAYPRKVGKGAAETAWKKAKPNAELVKTILQAVEEHKHCTEWTRDNGQYIPNPSTWLNQRRWEDEPANTISHSKKTQRGDGASYDLEKIRKRIEGGQIL